MSKINTTSNCSWPALPWGMVFSCQMKWPRSWENIVCNKFRFLKWQSGSGCQGEESWGELYLKIHISCPVIDWFFVYLFFLFYFIQLVLICLRINYSKYLFFKKFYWDVIHMLYSSPFSNTTQWFPIYYNIFKNCGNETVYLRWGLEPMFWELNPCGWDSNLCSSNWDCRPGFRTKWSSGSWCFISERIQWETKWQVGSGFIQRETSYTDRVWAIREGEWGLKMWHG